MFLRSVIPALVQGLLICLFLIGFSSAMETVEDAARIARKLVDSSSDSIGTMGTVYPSGHALEGTPFALQEYYASCLGNGSLTLLFLPISRHSQNILYSAAHSASITVATAPPRASRARVSLMGTVTVFTDLETVPELDTLKSCYLAKHPDAKWWLPGDENGAHISYWARFDPSSIYFVGGFGSSHYIGYIPTELYDRSGSGLDSSVDDGHVGFAPKPLAMASQIALAGRFTIEQVDAPL